MGLAGFLSEAAAGLVGTIVGLVFGLQLDRYVTRKREARGDVRLLQEVVDRLAGKRAFRQFEDAGLVDSPVDMDRCVQSVFDARERLARTAASLVVHEQARRVLHEMESDCAAYISYVERAPLRYATAALRLGDRLFTHEEELRSMVPQLKVRRPGSGNAASIDWLVS